MSVYFGFAIRFETSMSLDEMLPILNTVSSWRWRLSDSDRHGDKLWCYAGEAALLEIIEASPGWVIQVGFLPDAELTPDDIRRELEQVIFPALSARSIAPTDTVS